MFNPESSEVKYKMVMWKKRYTIILLIFICVRKCSSFPGCGVGNVAFNKPAHQASTLSVNGKAAVAGRAVDGNKNTDVNTCHSCTKTKVLYYAWWAVDLQGRYLVHSVEITSHEDAMNSVQIIVGRSFYPGEGVAFDHLCAEFDSTNSHPPNTTRVYTCNALSEGRYVMVRLRYTASLMLCEVGVNATPIDKDEANTDGICQVEFGYLPNVAPVNQPSLTIPVSSRVECALHCLNILPCLGFTVRNVADTQTDCEIFECISDGRKFQQNSSLYLPFNLISLKWNQSH